MKRPHIYFKHPHDDHERNQLFLTLGGLRDHLASTTISCCWDVAFSVKALLLRKKVDIEYISKLSGKVQISQNQTGGDNNKH